MGRRSVGIITGVDPGAAWPGYTFPVVRKVVWRNAESLINLVSGNGMLNCLLIVQVALHPVT